MLKNILKIMFINIFRLIFYLFFEVRIENLDKLPKNDNYIIASNHSSYLDPMLLIVFLKSDINFIAKKELFNTFLISFFVKLYDSIAVDRNNFSPITLKEAIKRLNSNKIVGIFPEGTRVKDLSESKAYAGVSILAYYTNKQVVPVKIEGNLNWKTQLIKYLLKLKKYTINIIIKEPISFNNFLKDKYNIENINNLPKDKLKEVLQEFSDFVLKKIYS